MKCVIQLAQVLGIFFNLCIRKHNVSAAGYRMQIRAI